MPDDSALLEVLTSLRERGALGETSLPQAIEHADAFVAAIPPSTRRLIDLGSGGGLPGLVVAMRLPHVEVVLTDRRERRMDLLRLACSRLGLDHVVVLTADVVRLGGRVEYAAQFDAVTARSFGDPAWTLTCAVPFLTRAGVVVVSEPPEVFDQVRWPQELLDRLGLRRSAETFSRVRRFERTPA
jgi:16S rRNA G527 N7-methylase RsmG